MTKLSAQKVLQLATMLHENQFRRDGKPYITHPIIVGKICIDILELICAPTEDEKRILLSAAYLHDVIEDCNVTKEGLINNGIDEEVVKVVEMLTKSEDIDYADYIIRIVEHDMQLSLQQIPYASIVKYADMVHNSNGDVSKSKLEKYKLAMALIEMSMPERFQKIYQDIDMSLMKDDKPVYSSEEDGA